jgi:hypothetical protein
MACSCGGVRRLRRQGAGPLAYARIIGIDVEMADHRPVVGEAHDPLVSAGARHRLAPRTAGGLHPGDEDLVGRRVVGDGAHVEAHAHALALDLADLLGHDLQYGASQGGGEQWVDRLLESSALDGLTLPRSSATNRAQASFTSWLALSRATLTSRYPIPCFNGLPADAKWVRTSS